MNRTPGYAAAALLVSLGVAVGAALATPQMVSEAKKLGLPANNCQYCHAEALPKKDTFKPESLNARGQFLLADMKQRSLKAADLSKLKDYKEPK
jgi:hypothetical protein